MTADDKQKRPALPKMPFLRKMDDCDRPACDETVSAITSAMERLGGKTASTAAEAQQIECPPASPELGRASWTLLHSMAAWYPDKPSPEEEHLMVGFFSALARFYPCTWCATDFQQKIKEKPVQAKSRKDLCVWLCEQHNLVNKKLGKPIFKCDMNTLDERWRKSKNPKCYE